MQAFHGFTGPWNLDFVQQRTKNLAGLAWDRLAPWLDLSDDNESALPAGLAAAVARGATTGGVDEDELVADDSDESSDESTSSPALG
jgi:hypothetical protein